MTDASSPSRTDTLRRRLQRHFVTCSATAGAALACADHARADIVYFSSANDPALPAAIPHNFYGNYVNLTTGQVFNGTVFYSGFNAVGTPFVNFYPSAGGGTPVDAIYNNPATVLFTTTTPTGDLVAGLTAGTVIGPGLNFGGTLVPIGSNPGGGGLGGETYRGVDAVNFSATPFLGFQFVLNGSRISAGSACPARART
jgi:hypothetical protein